MRNVGLIWIALLALVSSASVGAADERATQGLRLFLQNCASCHGTGARGDGPDADLFARRPRDLREGFVGKYDDASLIRRIREGRSLTLAVDRAALQRHADQVDQLTRYLRRLPTIDWETVEPGWAQYVDRCEICHGPTGEGPTFGGISKPPTSLLPITRRGSDLVESVRHERPHMPRLEPRVAHGDARQIASFVDLFSEGFSLYSRICAHCHSDDGRGVESLGEVAGELFELPDVVFDKAFFEATDPADLRAAVWHMLEKNKPAMPHFRRSLTAVEASAIVRYLRTLAPSEPDSSAK